VVLGLLGKNRPVAVTLPVFKDPLGRTDNWNTRVARTYGRVINPPPTSLAVGGHAVCVTGFRPDAAEPHGGYFVFRNSWGVSWASTAPASAVLGGAGTYFSPEPGYGDISASYVDSYLWEVLQL
jgi:hypothetical protein